MIRRQPTEGASMSQEIAKPITVVSPRTGEVVALDAPSEDLGGYLLDVREQESLLREAKRLVSQELLNRMDRTASWTHRGAGLKITGQSPSPVEEWDGERLRNALLGLVDKGLLDLSAVYAAVEIVPTFKVHRSGVSSLRKLGGEVADTVNGLCVRSERERRVSVSRA